MAKKPDSSKKKKKKTHGKVDKKASESPVIEHDDEKQLQEVTKKDIKRLEKLCGKAGLKIPRKKHQAFYQSLASFTRNGFLKLTNEMLIIANTLEKTQRDAKYPNVHFGLDLLLSPQGRETDTDSYRLLGRDNDRFDKVAELWDKLRKQLQGTIYSGGEKGGQEEEKKKQKTNGKTKPEDSLIEGSTLKTYLSVYAEIVFAYAKEIGLPPHMEVEYDDRSAPYFLASTSSEKAETQEWTAKMLFFVNNLYGNSSLRDTKTAFHAGKVWEHGKSIMRKATAEIERGSRTDLDDEVIMLPRTEGRMLTEKEIETRLRGELLRLWTNVTSNGELGACRKLNIGDHSGCQYVYHPMFIKEFLVRGIGEAGLVQRGSSKEDYGIRLDYSDTLMHLFWLHKEVLLKYFRVEVLLESKGNPGQMYLYLFREDDAEKRRFILDFSRHVDEEGNLTGWCSNSLLKALLQLWFLDSCAANGLGFLHADLTNPYSLRGENKRRTKFERRWGTFLPAMDAEKLEVTQEAVGHAISASENGHVELSNFMTSLDSEFSKIPRCIAGGPFLVVRSSKRAEEVFSERTLDFEFAEDNPWWSDPLNFFGRVYRDYAGMGLLSILFAPSKDQKAADRIYGGEEMLKALERSCDTPGRDVWPPGASIVIPATKKVLETLKKAKFWKTTAVMLQPEMSDDEGTRIESNLPKLTPAEVTRILPWTKSTKPLRFDRFLPLKDHETESESAEGKGGSESSDESSSSESSDESSSSESSDESSSSESSDESSSSESESDEGKGGSKSSDSAEGKGGSKSSDSAEGKGGSKSSDTAEGKGGSKSSNQSSGSESSDESSSSESSDESSESSGESEPSEDESKAKDCKGKDYPPTYYKWVVLHHRNEDEEAVPVGYLGNLEPGKSKREKLQDDDHSNNDGGIIQDGNDDEEDEYLPPTEDGENGLRKKKKVAKKTDTPPSAGFWQDGKLHIDLSSQHWAEIAKESYEDKQIRLYDAGSDDSELVRILSVNDYFPRLKVGDNIYRNSKKLSEFTVGKVTAVNFTEWEYTVAVDEKFREKRESPSNAKKKRKPKTSQREVTISHKHAKRPSFCIGEKVELAKKPGEPSDPNVSGLVTDMNLRKDGRVEYTVQNPVRAANGELPFVWTDENMVKSSLRSSEKAPTEGGGSSSPAKTTSSTAKRKRGSSPSNKNRSKKRKENSKKDDVDDSSPTRRTKLFDERLVSPSP